ncbi:MULTISPECIES: TrkA family potassium uptake protein [unclassified Modicisalibacter]|uniref:potassium channel family protein n=1 Tax=unclassified Modicisalibacter TaxID=2679913 RepID=UPI001CCAB6AF|nr:MULTISPECIES: TrkA family potassium uptake protein [unclassified Modicisalibacter]MBZ9557139.1 TrkA family potassium uptake protein [Modicisalibacter sp. R2A 31.J]MBZ9574147.1 TrkA family potassium uptake protein [Modicisalibacter sp. MOD 31.J]
MTHQFAILGLGYFGVTVAQELRRQHNDVLGVDHSEDRVNALSDLLTHAVVADVTNEKALAELSLGEYDAVVVDVDDNIEASMICTLLAREQGAQEIWVKAHSDTHYRLLKHIGADHVVYPEYDTGLRVAESLHYRAMVDFIQLGDRQFIVELQTTEKLNDNCPTVADLELDKANLALVAIKRGKEVLHAPSNEAELHDKDHLVLMGDLDDLRELGKKL